MPGFLTEGPPFLSEGGGGTEEYEAGLCGRCWLIEAEGGAEIAKLLPAELDERFGVTPDAARLARVLAELARVGPYRA